MDTAPPPPPPPPSAAVSTLAAPMTTTEDGSSELVEAAASDEEICRQALWTASTRLEKARCMEAEMEAWTGLSAWMLRYHGDPQTMFVAAATSSAPMSDNNSTSNSSGGIVPSGVTDALTVLAEAVTVPVESDQGSKAKKSSVVVAGGGQLGKAVQTFVEAYSLKRMADQAASITADRMTEGPALKKALHDLSSVSRKDPNVWLTILDERLHRLRAYHAQHEEREEAILSNHNKRSRTGNPVADGYDLAASVRVAVQPLVDDETLFSVEEVMGKYLDLQSIFETDAKNLRALFQAPKQKSRDKTFNRDDSVDYIYFLETLAQGLGHESLPESTKLQHRKAYVRLITNLQTYLELFLGRTCPLLDLNEIKANAVQAFEDEWGRTGGSPGWQAKPAEALLARADLQNAQPETDSSSNSINLDDYVAAEELAAKVDGDRLKAELARLGLKCGGTIQDRAQRLFLTKHALLSDLPAKLFVKKPTLVTGTTATNSVAKPNTNDAAVPEPSLPTVAARREHRVDIARREAIVTALLDQVRPALEATIRRCERRQTQTLTEREREFEEELYGGSTPIDRARMKKQQTEKEGDNDDDDEPIYNPKNVPLDFDGRPMPYWLFKLHGLNHYYPCEICGGESYRGRRNFELHFAEQRHAAGMRSLGIPNTKHFHGVTKIEDAQRLWEALRMRLDKEQFDGTREEEYEDSHGNVLSRTTYEDLARQGLL